VCSNARDDDIRMTDSREVVDKKILLQAKLAHKLPGTVDAAQPSFTGREKSRSCCIYEYYLDKRRVDRQTKELVKFIIVSFGACHLAIVVQFLSHVASERCLCVHTIGC